MALRLMPLGASITYGSGSSDGNGFRKFLRELLVNDGYTVRMVGSLKAGTMENNDNEGWRGYRIDQIEERGKLSAAEFQPNIFTINAGTNDCLQNHGIEGAGERMRHMLDELWKLCPDATMIISTVLVNSTAGGTVEPRVIRVNEQYREVARRCVAEGKRVVLVDMHGPDGPQLRDLVDGTHPDDVGYFKMASIWHRGILEAETKGFLGTKRWADTSVREDWGLRVDLHLDFSRGN